MEEWNKIVQKCGCCNNSIVKCDLCGFTFGAKDIVSCNMNNKHYCEFCGVND